VNQTALAIIDSNELDTIQRTGRLLANSGYFDGKGDTPQAIAMMATKILAGREMGFGPFASVNGVHIIQGKPTVGANLMASAVKASGRYTYRVLEMSSTECRIEFFERNGDKWDSIGVSTFTMKDAQDAQVTGNPTWKKFPRNMLFARAMSNGVRWYCPDIFSGNAVYVPEELGAEVDMDGNVVDTTYTVQESRKATQTVAVLDSTNGAHETPQQAATPATEGDTLFDQPHYEPPTDAELDVLGKWATPADAKAWAVAVGACENEFAARNSLKKVVDEYGGSLTKENIAAVYLTALRKWNAKLEQKAAA
jgi:hypothetical protein